MRDFDTLHREVKIDYKTLKSWRLVAQKWRLSKGTTYRIAHNIEPKTLEIRLLLDLPLPEARVIAIAGIVPNGTQTIGALRCICGDWFIPNHPRRRKCFICSPYRKGGKHHVSHSANPPQ